MVLIFISIMTNDECLFLCMSLICIFFEEISINIFCLFSNQIFNLFTVDGQRELFSSLKSSEICPSRFKSCLGHGTPFFLLILPFRRGLSILCLSHYCILEVGKLSGFTGSQLEKYFALGGITHEYHSYLV